MQLARAEAIPSSTDVLKESAEIIPIESGVSEGGGEVALASEVAPAIETEAAPTGGDTSKGGAKSRPTPAASRPKRATASDAVALKGVAGKRAPPSEAIPEAPTSKKARGSQRPAPALPPLEKGKKPVGLLSSAPDNEVLNAEDITPQSPASTVVELLRETMFGGVTEASNPRLLALTNLLAYSTREQVAFRSSLGAVGRHGQGDAPHGELCVFPSLVLSLISLFLLFSWVFLFAR